MTDPATLTSVKNKVRHALSRGNRERALEVTQAAHLTPDEVLQVWGGTRDWAVLTEALRQGADPDQRIEGAMGEQWFLFAELVQNGHTAEAQALLDLLSKHPRVEAWMDRPFAPSQAFQKDLSLVDALLTRGRWQELDTLNQRYPHRTWPRDAQGCAPWQRIRAYQMTQDGVDRFARWGWLPSPEAVDHATFPLVSSDEQPQVRRYREMVRQALGMDLQKDPAQDARQFIEACLKAKPSTSQSTTPAPIYLERAVTDPVQELPETTWTTPYAITDGKHSGNWTMLAALTWARIVEGIHPNAAKTTREAPGRSIPLSDLDLHARLASLSSGDPCWEVPLLAPTAQAPVTLRGLVDWLGVQQTFAKEHTPHAWRPFERPPASRMADVLGQAQTFLPRMGARRHREDAGRLFALLFPAMLFPSIQSSMLTSRSTHQTSTVKSRSAQDPMVALLKSVPFSVRQRLNMVGQGLTSGVLFKTNQVALASLLGAIRQAWADDPTTPVFSPNEGRAIATFLREPPENAPANLMDSASIGWAVACLVQQQDPVALLQQTGCPFTDADLAHLHPEADALLPRLLALRRAQELAQRPEGALTHRSRRRV